MKMESAKLILFLISILINYTFTNGNAPQHLAKPSKQLMEKAKQLEQKINHHPKATECDRIFIRVALDFVKILTQSEDHDCICKRQHRRSINGPDDYHHNHHHSRPKRRPNYGPDFRPPQPHYRPPFGPPHPPLPPPHYRPPYYFPPPPPPHFRPPYGPPHPPPPPHYRPPYFHPPPPPPPPHYRPPNDEDHPGASIGGQAQG